MPTILPGPPRVNAPYDTAEKVLQLARAKINDMIASAAGDVLQDSQPFTQVFFNNAYRKMQERLADLNYSRCTKEIVIPNLPVGGSQDPASKYWISWTQVYDGANFWPAPVLPQDLIIPVKLWERVSGNPSGFVEMELWIDGMPTGPKQWRNRIWDWREDSIFMPGAQFETDLRVRYQAYMPDIVNSGPYSWTLQPVPFMRCLEPLACYIAFEVCNARGDLDAASFMAQAEAGVDKMMNRDIKQKQRVNLRRLPRGGSGYNRGDW